MNFAEPPSPGHARPPPPCCKCPGPPLQALSKHMGLRAHRNFMFKVRSEWSITTQSDS